MRTRGCEVGTALLMVCALLIALVATARAGQPVETPAPASRGATAPAGVPAGRSEADVAAARRHIAEGDAFLKKGDQLRRRNPRAAAGEYQRALAAYKAAFALVASPKIYFGIATAEQRLGRWVDAAGHYRQLLAEVAASGDTAALRRLATEGLDAVVQRLGVLALAVTPAGATITVDGRPVGTSPLSQPLLLAPGEYTIGFLAPGHAPREITIRIEAGSELERTIAMAPQPVIVEAPRPAPRRQKPMPAASTTALWASAGATVALAAAATTTGVLALGHERTFEDTSRLLEDREDARRRGRRLSLISDALIGATAVTGAFTAYYYVAFYRRRAVRVTPYASREGAGLAVSGSF